ncbi:MAG: type III-A CRISPR-associated RAMP protein Csm4 [Bacteroidales bacterium]|jgi:CRISPR-associated protein Csm4|nr:type III-A CRISPR-associated RAMP protein Csm4 [Bacteroidales bacterium]
MSKKTFTIYKLKFKSALHISRGKDDEDYSKSDSFIHSDTLKSAIFSTAVLLNSELQNEVNGEKFFNSFLLSSTFPYFKDTLFLPKPKGKLPFTDTPNEEPSYDFKKDLKKINFIDLDLFLEFFKEKNEKKILKNDKKFVFASDYLLKPELLEKGKCLEENKEQKEKFCDKKSFSVLKSEVQERVYIRKYNEIFDSTEKNKPVFSDPYIVDKIYFNDDAGLYFLVEQFINFDEVFFDKVLKNLGDFGIGTDRNVGNGQFEIIAKQTKEFNFADNSNYLMNLSLFLPTENEVEKFTENCQYKLIKRGGWISNITDLEILNNEIIEQNKQKVLRKKKSVNMIDEASVFENNVSFTGKYVDLNPEKNNIKHPIWREGRAIFIPINNIKI